MAVIDFDDTLIPTRSGRIPLFKQALTDLGARVDAADLMTHYGKGFREFVRGCAPAVDYDALLDHYSGLISANPIAPLPGAFELLVSLRVAGTSICVFTASIRRLAELDLCLTGLDKYVTQLLTSDDTRAPKPDPRSVANLMRVVSDLGGSPSTTLYVGDGPTDAWLATEAGYAFRGVTSGATSRADFVKYGVHSEDVYDDLLDLTASLAASRNS